MVNERPAPQDVDASTPNAARMYDYALGGKDNYAADRAAAEELRPVFPGGYESIRENRAFLGRAVRYLAGEAGIRQFLDVGSGLPTQENVHEVAHGIAPDARVVYVDYDPVVVAHARSLLSGVGTATITQADVRQPEAILDSPEVREYLDLSRPVAVLLAAVLHLVTDDEDPAGIMAKFRSAMAPGSFAVLSHTTSEDLSAEAIERTARVFARAREPMVLRDRERIESFLDGFELVDPGLVHVGQRPENSAADEVSGWILGAVGRKP